MKIKRHTKRMLSGLMFFAFVAMLPMFGPDPVYARDVPFSSEQTVDGEFDGAADIVAADVDGDGDLDIVGAAWNIGEIAWWENTAADGSAWSKHLVADIDGAAGIAVADVDGDGDLDIVGTGFYVDEIAWWENDGTPASGTWSKHSVGTAFDFAVQVAVADVDGDGDLDIVGTATIANEIAWWENGSTPGSDLWTKHSVTTGFGSVHGVDVADVDGDGDLDIFSAAQNGNEIAWWENDGTPGSGSWPKHSVDANVPEAVDVAAADVDGDGDLDVLGSAFSGNEIAWWENDGTPGSGAWSKHSLDSNVAGAHNVAAADVDGDGDLDVLGTANIDNEIAWWENESGDGSVWSKKSLATDFVGAAGVAAADVDGDGDMDILGSAATDRDIAWWENETIHRSAFYPDAGKVVVDGDCESTTAVAAADLDGDGDQDLLGTSSSTGAGRIGWYINTAGDGSAWSEHTWPWSDAYDVTAGDVDGDGDRDIIGSSWGGDIRWFENTVGDGSHWGWRLVKGDWLSGEAVAGADVDGDGDLDILAAGIGSTEGGSPITEIAWWENVNGDGSAWSTHNLIPFYDSTHDITTADIDGDGDLDILAAVDTYQFNNPGGPAWWENTNGDGTVWVGQMVDASFANAQAVAAADMDGDGDLDILGGARIAIDGYDRIAWWENESGDGSAWTKHTVDRHFEYAESVAAADLDADGDLDIYSASGVSGGLAWWENVNQGSEPGDGSAWTKHAMGEHHGEFWDAAAADVDGDGDLDLFAAAWRRNEIWGWQNRGGQFALATDDTAPAFLANGQTDDLLKIAMTHNGRSGDGDEELATLELLFEESEGDPLTSAEANAVFEELDIYLDDGSGDFEIGSDTLVATVDALALSDGVQTVTFADGDANVQVQQGTPRTYFVVIELAADAYTQTAIDQFRVTHITEGSSTAENRSHDIPLSLEYVADTASSVVIVPTTRVWDGDGTTENGSEDANWSRDGAPHTFDGVRFDSTSVKDATLDAGFVESLMGFAIVSGYAGQVTQERDLVLNGDYVQSDGTFAGGSSTLDIDGAFEPSGGAFTAPSGLMSVGRGFSPSGGAFDANGGRVVLDNASDQTLSAPSAFHDLTLNDGLLAYWKLDEGSGITAVDSSGYGHHGTLHGSPTWSEDTPGAIDFDDDRALHFDRTSPADYVSISDTPAIDDLQELCLSTWVYLDSTPGGSGYTYMRFAQLRNGKAVLRYVDHNGVGKLQFYMKINDNDYGVAVEQTWQTGNWRHVAGVYDGSEIRLYLDGVLQGSPLAVSGTVATGDGVWLSHSGSDEALDGLLDDVRFYNRALSLAEIQALANGQHPETSVAATTLDSALDVNGDLTLNSGTLDVSATDYGISVGGDLVYNGGVFNPQGGIVTLDGADSQGVDMTGIAFHHLLVNSGATLDDQNPAGLVVNGSLANNGTLQRAQGINDSTDATFFDTGGYGGLILNANNVGLGETTVQIRGNQDCATTTAGESVQRCFDIEPENIASRNAAITFYFAASELGGNDCNTLEAYHWNGSEWEMLARDLSYATSGRDCSVEPYSLRVQGVSDFSPFVLAGSTPLAVTLGYFLAEATDDGLVTFTWQTATESGVAGFHLLAEGGDGGMVRLNGELIPSPVIDSVEPTEYRFTANTEAERFFLREVGVDGSIAEHGPFEMGVAYGSFVQAGGDEKTPKVWLPVLMR